MLNRRRIDNSHGVDDGCQTLTGLPPDGLNAALYPAALG
jgi:hypothetical protein